MTTLEKLKKYSLLAILLVAFVGISCDDDDPEEEEEVEVITNVVLVFTNNANAQDVVRARAEDPDGEGATPLQVLDPIGLTSGVTYTLTYEITNALDPADVEDIAEEILEEDDEHQFFFSFTDGAFTSPMGNGNIDNAADPINYNDQDDNQNPVGLNTTWTAGAALTGGNFTVRLQHQPDIKTATTGANDGDTDFNLPFVLNITAAPVASN